MKFDIGPNKYNNMKKWNFKVKDNLQEIIKKLESTFGSTDGFVFNLDTDQNDSVRFEVQRRGLYLFQIMFINKIIVKGKILKTDTENETNIEISFTQNILTKLIIYTHTFLGLGFLITIILRNSNSASIYILGGILLVVGIVLLIAVQKKFEKNIQEYKILISQILES